MNSAYLFKSDGNGIVMIDKVIPSNKEKGNANDEAEKQNEDDDNEDPSDSEDTEEPITIDGEYSNGNFATYTLNTLQQKQKQST